MDKDSIDPQIWNYLRKFEPELLTRFERGDPLANAQLEQKYEGLLELLGPKKKPRMPSERVRTIGPDKRSAALADVVARTVTEAFPAVGEFRARYLAGRLLLGKQIVNWIETQRKAEGAPAPVYLRMPVSESRFEGKLSDGTELTDGLLLGDELTEHRASARSEAEYLAGTRPFSPEEYADYLTRAAERVRKGEVIYGDVEHAHPRKSRIAVPGGTHTRELACRRATKPRELHYCAPPAESSDWQHVQAKTISIRNDSVLAELKWLAEHLMDAVPCWFEEHQVVAFILSGCSPQFPKIIGRLRLSRGDQPGRFFGPASRIELNIDPRMTPSAVARFYHELRRVLVVVGRDRAMDDKQLALALFTDAHGRQGAHWRDLRERWNERYPDWQYPTDDRSARRFGLDCRTAWSRLTGVEWPDATRDNDKRGGAT
ncbi:MAG: hypothetical protein ACLQUT_02345 [Thermoleophilia bacterium]